MRKSNHLLLTLIATTALGTQAFATEQQQQTLELDTADVEVLQLVTVESEAKSNANEIHQESMVGRAGLQGGCIIPPEDGLE